MTRTVTRQELLELIADGGVTVVDALPRDHYDEQHLPGAVNLVAADVATAAPELLPDRTAPVVTYCSDGTCGNSRQVARALEAMGYSDVRTYPEGMKDWRRAGLPVERTSR